MKSPEDEKIEKKVEWPMDKNNLPPAAKLPHASYLPWRPPPNFIGFVLNIMVFTALFTLAKVVVIIIPVYYSNAVWVLAVTRTAPPQ